MEALKVKQYSKTSDAYGKGNNLEAYPLKHLNRKTDGDLMPCPRRPPKKWLTIVLKYLNKNINNSIQYHTIFNYISPIH